MSAAMIRSRMPGHASPAPTAEQVIAGHSGYPEIVIDLPTPQRGAIVTYLDPTSAGTPYRSGVSCGAEVIDPETSERWFSVLRPGAGSTIVDAALVVAVELTPAVRQHWSDAD